MFVRRSAAVHAALVAGTRTRRQRDAQIRRAVNASLREAATGVRMATPVGDSERDIAAEEAEALAAQAAREAELIEQQRRRE